MIASNISNGNSEDKVRSPSPSVFTNHHLAKTIVRIEAGNVKTQRRNRSKEIARSDRPKEMHYTCGRKVVHVLVKQAIKPDEL